MTSKLNSNIKKATFDDIPDILDIIGSHKAKWDKPIAKKYFDDFFKYPMVFKSDKIYVLEKSKKNVGVIGYSIDKYEANNYWLGWFYIHKDYCNKKLGKTLFTFVKEELQNMKVNKLFVDTSSDPFYRGALILYLKFGFKLEAIIKNYYGKNEDQVILSVDL